MVTINWTSWWLEWLAQNLRYSMAKNHQKKEAGGACSLSLAFWKVGKTGGFESVGFCGIGIRKREGIQRWLLSWFLSHLKLVHKTLFGSSWWEREREGKGRREGLVNSISYHIIHAWVILNVIPMSFLCPSKNEVAFKITMWLKFNFNQSQVQLWF